MVVRMIMMMIVRMMFPIPACVAAAVIMRMFLIFMAVVMNISVVMVRVFMAVFVIMAVFVVMRMLRIFMAMIMVMAVFVVMRVSAVSCLFRFSIDRNDHLRSGYAAFYALLRFVDDAGNAEPDRKSVV